MKVRFAPSPTGFLHVGNIRTALINWLFVQKNGGTFLLRMDDTDVARNNVLYEKSIHEDLAWLGITPHEYARQSTRFDRYSEIADILKQKGRLYPCYETPEELALKRKLLQMKGLPPIYDRASLSLKEQERYEKEGRKPHWRFLLTDTPVEWDDLVRGPVHFEGAKLSDPVLIREDGFPLYTLASVVDDIDLGVTHIIRGEDHVANTAVQLQLIEALGGSGFTFAHLTLLADEEGSGLSKRLGSLGVKDLREQGFLPMAINSFLAKLGTSDSIEPHAQIQDLISEFDFKKFSRGTPKFSLGALEGLNTKLLHTLSFEDAKPWITHPEIDSDFWEAVRGNMTSFSELDEWWKICHEKITPTIHEEDHSFLKKAYDILLTQEISWEAWYDALKQQTGRRGKALFMPLRQALTGKDHGPEFHKILTLIGRNKVLERLKVYEDRPVA